MTAPISATNTTPAPAYPASFFFTNSAHRRGGDLTIGAQLPDAYMAHLVRTQARNQADLNLGVADMAVGNIVDRLIRKYDLEATTTMTITEVVGHPILSRWHSCVSLLGTATITFTDNDDQTHTMTTDGEVSLDHSLFVDTAHRRGHGQSLGLSPEQIQEMENLTNPHSVVTYLNTQCEQAPLVITDLTWKIADIV